MIVLGIDPGTVKTGFGVVSVDGGVIRHVDSGVVATLRKAPLEDRLLTIYNGLVEVIERQRPEVVAVEDVFFAKHPQGALKLGHARGVCLLAAARSGMPVQSYPPAMVKRALSGHGRADKEQVARLVTMVLSLREQPGSDEADALAVAVCHAAGASRRLKAARP